MTAKLLTYGKYRAAEYGIETLPRVSRGMRYGAIWNHAMAGNAFTVGSQVAPYIVDALAEDGYPVHSGDYCAAAYQQGPLAQVPFVGNQCYPWGNPDHLVALAAAWTRLQAMGARAGKFYGAGASGGSLGLLNFARANPAEVGALVLYIPVLDLNDIYINNKDGSTASIGTAYGVVPPAAIPAPTLATSSPTVYGAAALGNIPILIMSSDDDPVASNTASCIAWAAGRPNIIVQSLGAVGHTTPATANPQDVVSFFAANGGRS